MKSSVVNDSGGHAGEADGAVAPECVEVDERAPGVEAGGGGDVGAVVP